MWTFWKTLWWIRSYRFREWINRWHHCVYCWNNWDCNCIHWWTCECRRKSNRNNQRSSKMCTCRTTMEVTNLMDQIAFVLCLYQSQLTPKTKSGQSISARELFKGVKLNNTKDMCPSFGDYCQVYWEPVRSNSMEPRSVGAIALCPKDNYSRCWLFMDLNTGHVFSSIIWEVVPVNEY